MTLINDKQQWQAANQARAALYRWFAELFASELTTKGLQELQLHYPNLHQAFTGLDLQSQSERVQKALNNLKVIPEGDRALELAADFAHIFLLSGIESAPPYASYYLEKDQMLYGKPAQQMSQFLAEHKLELHPEFREPKDHISIYLQVMTLWVKHGGQVEEHNNTDNSHADEDELMVANEQLQFLQQALLNWLPKFNGRCQQIRVKTDFYPALTELLLHFVTADQEALQEMLSA